MASTNHRQEEQAVQTVTLVNIKISMDNQVVKVVLEVGTSPTQDRSTVLAAALVNILTKLAEQPVRNVVRGSIMTNIVRRVRARVIIVLLGDITPIVVRAVAHRVEPYGQATLGQIILIELHTTGAVTVGRQIFLVEIRCMKITITTVIQIDEWLDTMVEEVICGDAIVLWMPGKKHLIATPVTNTPATIMMTVHTVGKASIQAVGVFITSVKQVVASNTTNWCISTPLDF